MFKLDFDLKTEAFRQRAKIEVIRILLAVATNVGRGRKSGTVRDRNGEAVGAWVWR